MLYLKSLFCVLFFLCLSSGYRHHRRYKSHLDPRNIERRSYPEHEKIQESHSTSSEDSTERDDQKVKLSVFYESLCPASVDFFVDQLGPTVEKLGQHLDIHLIPYGHAKTRAVNRTYRFKCQHGPEECYGNKLHACIIDVLQNSTRSALMNACLMHYTLYVPGYGYDYAGALAWCGYKLHFSYEGIRQCVIGHRGNLLLKRYGEETHHLKPRYVPFVVVDGSTDYQDRATDDLQSVICQRLKYSPPICKFRK